MKNRFLILLVRKVSASYQFKNFYVKFTPQTAFAVLFVLQG